MREITGQPKWTAKKYMGDDSHSWAIIDSRYLPAGHKGVVFNYLPTQAIYAAGLNSQMKTVYLQKAKDTVKKK